MTPSQSAPYFLNDSALSLGVKMSKDEAIKFGFFIKEESDRLKRELKKDEIIELYKKYLSK